MKRVSARQKRIRVLRQHSQVEAAERTGYGPTITAEGRFLTLRWEKEQVAEALNAAGMTLEQILIKHMATQLDATKTVHIRHRGEITTTFKRPDLRARFRMLKLSLELHGVIPEELRQRIFSPIPLPSLSPRQKLRNELA